MEMREKGNGIERERKNGKRENDMGKEKGRKKGKERKGIG
jgi:hypothetical protein